MTRDEQLAEWKTLLERVVTWEAADSPLLRAINRSLDRFESEFGIEFADCDPGQRKGWVRSVDSAHGPAMACPECRHEREVAA